MTQFDIKPEEVIQGQPWKYMLARTYIGFLREASRPKFGEEIDKKSVKVHADYVWKSML